MPLSRRQVSQSTGRNVLLLVISAVAAAAAALVAMYFHAQKVLGPRPKPKHGVKKLRRIRLKEMASKSS